MASKGFPRLTDRRTPKEKSLPLTCGHYATHKAPKVKGLVGETPTIPLHFTPHFGFIAESQWAVVRRRPP